MDLVDHFVRDGVFGKHAHKHFFDPGTSKAVRDQWLRDIDATCRAVGLGYVVREVIDENGNHGYEFGFTDRSAHAAFVFNAFGDLYQPRGHIQTHQFVDQSPAEQEAFFLAAEAHLHALGIHHDWRVINGQLQFAFDRFSDRLMFQALIEQGVIDNSARSIASIRAIQQRLGLATAPQAFGPGLEPG